MAARRRKGRPGRPWPRNLSSVKCTVEHGGSYFIGTPEATEQAYRRRREVAQEMLAASPGQTFLRERHEEGGPCAFVGPLTGEDETYWFYESPGPVDRMRKSSPAAHTTPCEHCPDRVAATTPRSQEMPGPPRDGVG